MASSIAGEVVGLHYLTGERIHVVWRDGRVTGVNPAPATLNSEMPFIAPGLMDLQVNGYGGIDFQSKDLDLPSFERAALTLGRDGCTRFFPTLITDDWEQMMTQLSRLVRLRSESPLLSRAISGWHIEGPFLSSEPGYCGTHQPSAMLDPAPVHLDRIQNITGAHPVLLTVAPERPGSGAFIREAVARGWKVSLGHTNASVEQLRIALEAGASMFTHLGNGCVSELNRHDNILWRVLDNPPPFVTLIPDGIHVSPALFRLMHRLLGDRIVYITDAMAAAGSGPGVYRLGQRSLQVGSDGVVREPGKPWLSGSALASFDGVHRAAGMLSQSWPLCWRMFAEAPARALGLKNEIAVGAPADFCVIAEAGSDKTVQAVGYPNSNIHRRQVV